MGRRLEPKGPEMIQSRECSLRDAEREAGNCRAPSGGRGLSLAQMDALAEFDALADDCQEAATYVRAELAGYGLRPALVY